MSEDPDKTLVFDDYQQNINEFKNQIQKISIEDESESIAETKIIRSIIRKIIVLHGNALELSNTKVDFEPTKEKFRKFYNESQEKLNQSLRIFNEL